MPEYVFVFSVDRGEPDPCTRTSNFGGRVYDNDRRAVAAAIIMFKNRTCDANDELKIYDGRVNGWGTVVGHDGGDPRYLGMVAYDASGDRFRFFPC